jgi:hypothetical protein
VQAGGEIVVGDGGGRMGAGAGYGHDGLFGSVLVSVRSLTTTLGTNQPLTLDNRVHLCPLVTVGFVERRSVARGTVSAGASLGFLARNSAAVALVPAVGLRLYSEAGGRPFGEASAALGITFRARLLVRPALTRAFTPDRANTASIALSYGF